MKQYDYDTYQQDIRLSIRANLGTDELSEDLYDEVCDTSKISYEDAKEEFSYGEIDACFLNGNLKEDIINAVVNGGDIETEEDSISFKIPDGYKITIDYDASGRDVIAPFTSDVKLSESNAYAFPLAVSDDEISHILSDYLYEDKDNNTFEFRDYLCTGSAKNRAAEVLAPYYSEEEVEKLTENVQTIFDAYDVIDEYVPEKDEPSYDDEER